LFSNAAWNEISRFCMDEASLKHFYDAREAARAILRFTAGRSYEDFCADEMLSSAIERKFEIIGEALVRIRRQRPEDLRVIGDWPAIIGFRNILAHAYEQIEDAVVLGYRDRTVASLP
ncbi:MAG: DUF86 domain-containing protein, partial [Verrucomicrobia bacterium]|nr:DUF86 domain-containing protein [Verrucomicrobiota bacterium]